MTTEEELDALVERSAELSKEYEECRRVYEETQRAREEFAASLGVTADELAGRARAVIEHVREHGTPQEKAELAAVEEEAKAEFEKNIASVQANVDFEMARRHHPKRKRRVRSVV